MKKSYLMIAAVAALFAACAEKDTFKDINQSEGPLISFSTYTQKATRAENSDTTYAWSLSDHHLTFSVYGYKNTDTKAVFYGDSVGFDNTNGWGYAINRYWDKTATTYEFYAFAPDKAPFTFNRESNSIETQKDGYFTIENSFSKVGDNVSPMNVKTPVVSWKEKSTDNIDLMIADTCSLSGTSLTNAQKSQVTLNFIHVLSRLNITVKTINELDPAVTTNDSLCVDSIIIFNFAHAGTFSEKQGNVNKNDLQKGTTKRWTATDNAKYRYDIDYTATPEPIYVVEALMIPQEAKADTINSDGTFPANADQTAPYLKIAYSIYSYNPKNVNGKSQNKEHYIAYYNLAKVFGIKTENGKLAFNEGWQNTLNITISPAIIDFDAMVAPWVDFKIDSLTVK